MEREDKRAQAESYVRLTLNPKAEGYFVNNLLSRVDLPQPLGPDKTSGMR